jgi:DNA-nicking Smr family endonuclease
MNWKPGSRKRALTAEEADLWAFAMRDARALARRERTRRNTSKIDHTAEIGLESETTALQAAPAAISQSKSSTPKPFANRVTVPPEKPPLASFEEKDRRRISRNPELIDARLDLHGMRQREAHSALRSFLLNAASRGHKHVLVITGKGVSVERQRDHFMEERGVLRRLVPQWLGEPEMRNLVVSYTASHVRHGGDGALYVKLRRMRDR